MGLLSMPFQLNSQVNFGNGDPLLVTENATFFLFRLAIHQVRDTSTTPTPTSSKSTTASVVTSSAGDAGLISPPKSLFLLNPKNAPSFSPEGSGKIRQ